MANQIIDKALAYLGNDLIITRLYQYAYTIPGNGQLTVTKSDLQCSTPTGYRAMGIGSAYSGNSNVTFISMNPISNDAVILKNHASGSVTATVYFRILYVKRGISSLT